MLLPLLLSVSGAIGDLVVVEKVEVLAANVKTKRAALRLTTNLDPQYGDGEEPPAPPVSCGYGGMPKGSTSGVTLLLWDLEKGAAAAEYVVYAVAQKKKDCTARAESTRRLADAKKAFADAGLDLAAPPATADVSGLACELKVENEDDECGWTKTNTCRLRGAVVSVDTSQANCGPYLVTKTDRAWYVVDGAYFHVDIEHTESMRGSWDGWSISRPVAVPKKP